MFKANQKANKQPEDMEVQSPDSSKNCSFNELKMKKTVREEVTKIMGSREFKRDVAQEMKLLEDSKCDYIETEDIRIAFQSTLRKDSERNPRPIQNLQKHLSSIDAKLNKISDQMDKIIQQDHYIEESLVLEIMQSIVKKMATGKSIELNEPTKLSTGIYVRSEDDASGTSQSESYLLISEKKKENYYGLLKKYKEESKAQEIEDIFMSPNDLDLENLTKSFSFP